MKHLILSRLGTSAPTAAQQTAAPTDPPRRTENSAARQVSCSEPFPLAIIVAIDFIVQHCPPTEHPRATDQVVAFSMWPRSTCCTAISAFVRDCRQLAVDLDRARDTPSANAEADGVHEDRYR